MIKKIKICSDVMRKIFNKELLMTKEDNLDFKNSNKCWICDVKVRDRCHITGKFRVFAHRDCNINLKLSHKILVVFHNLKNHNFYFIDSFQFLSSYLDSLVKTSYKDDFRYFSEEFFNNLLDLFKQKGFCPYKYLSDFENFKEELP